MLQGRRGAELPLQEKKENQSMQVSAASGGYPFVEHAYPRDNSTGIMIPARSQPMYLRMFHDKTFGMWLLNESDDVFFDELNTGTARSQPETASNTQLQIRRMRTLSRLLPIRAVDVQDENTSQDGRTSKLERCLYFRYLAYTW